MHRLVSGHGTIVGPWKGRAADDGTVYSEEGWPVRWDDSKAVECALDENLILFKPAETEKVATTGGNFERPEDTVRRYAGELLRLQAGLEALDIPVRGPVDSAAVDSALKALQEYQETLRGFKCPDPHLGLATTRQLLIEVRARGKTEMHYQGEGSDMAMGAANLLDTLPGSMLDYRTVGSAS